MRSLNAQTANRPDLVLTTLQRWKRSGRLADEHFASIARGTLRNRLKEDWPSAYAILSYVHDASIALPSSWSAPNSATAPP
ncbi:hypothetical protein CW362_38045 [Streptomyces populi]|uniref:Uncharacterized protein n=1 Tax=Streptomyces populi TaxID=2058924 RepID=A0A2I0SDB1_9ACTN|nr:hypothetical protein [Streptomyces populi]PKT67899.1 hypothetical protein CW362_38045 [Streptomyces populi]